MKEETKDYCKYGILFTIAWNIVLFILLVITNLVEGNELFFYESTHWYDMPVIILIWSLVWYWIGYSLRKEFLFQRKYYQHKFQMLNQQKIKDLFKIHYLSRYAKILTVVCITAIPWYVIGYVRDHFNLTDIIIMSVLFIWSLILYFTARYLKRKVSSMKL